MLTSTITVLCVQCLYVVVMVVSMLVCGGRGRRREGEVIKETVC